MPGSTARASTRDQAANIRHWGFFAALALALFAILALPIAAIVLMVRAA